jgi:hypothetical protein
MEATNMVDNTEQITVADIEDGARIELESGWSVAVRVTTDEDMNAIPPWEWADGHGEVSGWRPKNSKRAGERVLYTDRNSVRFYDFAGAVETAIGSTSSSA